MVLTSMGQLFFLALIKRKMIWQQELSVFINENKHPNVTLKKPKHANIPHRSHNPPN